MLVPTPAEPADGRGGIDNAGEVAAAQRWRSVMEKNASLVSSTGALRASTESTSPPTGLAASAACSAVWGLLPVVALGSLLFVLALSLQPGIKQV